MEENAARPLRLGCLFLGLLITISVTAGTCKDMFATRIGTPIKATIVKVVCDRGRSRSSSIEVNYQGRLLHVVINRDDCRAYRENETIALKYYKGQAVLPTDTPWQYVLSFIVFLAMGYAFYWLFFR